ncbi:hypothetical protein C1701_21330 [Actinoalloteichus sp. AHMU CJ021]|uniref:hypothetical protein n=1 Tax=Actinoalloteichus sp. AHMU CJ021 TaxID=2072503 RepID=UPI000CA0808D|nr:hypothetical protein C1701_21330 [Actinoalloteichus sp. AHMU CJ021]
MTTPFPPTSAPAGDPPFRVLSDPADLPAVPEEVPPTDAQAWCSFVVWVPDRLPTGCVARAGTLRREAPPGRPDGSDVGRSPWSRANPCAYRFEVVGEGRRLRVKQFLYDWAVPALDHPSLWRSRTSARPLDGRHVLWFGVDYLGNRGTSARLGRTMVELSVLDGEFTEEELLDLHRSLRPADADAPSRLAAVPFAELSYWARHHDVEMVVVPTGIWRFDRDGDTAHEGDWVTPPHHAALLGALGLPERLGGLAVDSAARFTNAEGRTEVEVLYSGGPDRGRELRLVAQRTGRGRLVVPPRPSAHEWATRTTTTLRGTTVWLGWIDEDHGPFDCVGRAANGVEFRLVSGSGVGLDRRWFESASTELLAGWDPPAR